MRAGANLKSLGKLREIPSHSSSTKQMTLQNFNYAFLNLNAIQMLVAFGITFIITWILCKISKVIKLGHDKADGVQKFHAGPTSRLGGIAIAFGLAVAFSINSTEIQYSHLSEFQNISFWFLTAALPVWMAGLIEDVTHRVGPTIRLLMATLSAAWLHSTLGVSVIRTDVLPIDWILSVPGGSLLVTLLVVAGFTHSVNIVDGFHGLASGLIVITLCALSYMAAKASDALILQLCLTVLFVVLGFFVFNWPNGLIFLGDAGAYLIGFLVVELGIFLAMRNPSLSPMAPVVAGLLPLIETLFSIYRRKIIRGHPVNHPDALHLHSLVYRRLLHSPVSSNNTIQKNTINSRVAIFFWLPAVLFAILSCVFMQSTWIQLILMLLYLTMYLWLYKNLVQFKSPKFMNFRSFK